VAVIETASGALWFEHAGEAGPRLLLVQGAGFPGEAWRPQFEALAVGHRVAWFDHRGIGRSPMGSGAVSIAGMAADGFAVLDAMGWADAVVVGHSMGGRVARRMAIEAPGRVRGLVLIASVFRRVMPPPLSMLPIMLRYPLWAGARRQAVLDQTFSRAWQAEVGREAAAARLEALLGVPLEDFPRRVPWHQVNAMRRDGETEGRIGEIRAPTLVIGAEGDKVLSPKNSGALADAIAGARRVMLRGCGHGLTIERADEVNGLIRGFVGGLAGGAEG